MPLQLTIVRLIALDSSGVLPGPSGATDESRVADSTRLELQVPRLPVLSPLETSRAPARIQESELVSRVQGPPRLAFLRRPGKTVRASGRQLQRIFPVAGPRRCFDHCGIHVENHIGTGCQLKMPTSFDEPTANLSRRAYPEWARWRATPP